MMTNLIASSLEYSSNAPFKISQIFNPSSNKSQSGTPTVRQTEEVKMLNDKVLGTPNTIIQGTKSAQWSTASIATNDLNLTKALDDFIFQGGCSRTFRRPNSSPRCYSYAERKLWAQEEHFHWKHAYEEGAIDGIGHKNIIDHL